MSLDAGVRCFERLHLPLGRLTLRSLMSLSPSHWNQSPIEVIWRREAEGFDDESVAVENFWTAGDLEARLARAMAPIRSWAQLQQVSERGFPGLTFGEDCFSPLRFGR